VGASATNLPSSAHFPGSTGQIRPNERVDNFLEGEVVDDGGNAIWDATVALRCGTENETQAKTTTKGTFFVQIRAKELEPVCDIAIDATMYAPARLMLKLGESLSIVQVGRIVLHRVETSPVETSASVSALSLAAPQSAKKAFEKGLNEVKKRKWDAACAHLRKAVQAYPQYAIAWLELGRAQVQQGNVAEAQHSFEEATTQDPHLIAAYIELTRLAAKQKLWDLLANITDRALQVATPDSALWFYFFNSFAKLSLGELKQAETSVTRGLRADTKHEVPPLEYLYALILAERQNYPDATEHLRRYLDLAPHATDAQFARDKLSEFEARLTSK